MTENWRAVPEWNGFYEVSDQGKVRSLDRVVVARTPRGDIGTRAYRGRILTLAKGKRGYLHVALSAPGRRQESNVHALVALAFLGPCPAGLQVCHDDGVKSNNRLGNLRYDTPANNAADKVRHGTHTFGPAHHAYKHGKYANAR